MTDQTPGFYVLRHVMDGESEGLAFQELALLSTQWLYICRAFISQKPAAFEEAWRGPLAHISTKLASSAGVALVSFKVGGVLAASVLLASGTASIIEAQVIDLFIDSLGKVDLIKPATPGKDAFFEELREITARPLMIVVPWPHAAISASDENLVRELSVHLAGAFFEQKARAE